MAAFSDKSKGGVHQALAGLSLVFTLLGFLLCHATFPASGLQGVKCGFHSCVVISVPGAYFLVLVFPAPPFPFPLPPPPLCNGRCRWTWGSCDP